MGGQDGKRKEFYHAKHAIFSNCVHFWLNPNKMYDYKEASFNLSRYPLFSILSNYDHPLEFGKMWRTVPDWWSIYATIFLLIPPTCMYARCSSEFYRFLKPKCVGIVKSSWQANCQALKMANNQFPAIKSRLKTKLAVLSAARNRMVFLSSNSSDSLHVIF